MACVSMLRMRSAVTRAREHASQKQRSAKVPSIPPRGQKPAFWGYLRRPEAVCSAAGVPPPGGALSAQDRQNRHGRQNLCLEYRSRGERKSPDTQPPAILPKPSDGCLRHASPPRSPMERGGAALRTGRTRGISTALVEHGHGHRHRHPDFHIRETGTSAALPVVPGATAGSGGTVRGHRHGRRLERPHAAADRRRRQADALPAHVYDACPSRLPTRPLQERGRGGLERPLPAVHRRRLHSAPRPRPDTPRGTTGRVRQRR